jgi:phosphoenolpyruvate carboxykinase (GTP)
VFATNYFLKNKEGRYLNDILDKLSWVIWAEGRVHNGFKAIETPIGYIPTFIDLKNLFKQYLDKDYKEEEYIQQFSIRPQKILEKLDRIENMYKKEKGVPKFFWNILNNQRKSLIDVKKKFDSEEISPLLF